MTHVSERNHEEPNTRMRSALCLVMTASLSACSVGAIDVEGGSGVDAIAAVSGPRLAVQATTSPSGGSVAPLNVVAVWVEAQGTFVKTIDLHASVQRQRLVEWVRASGGDDSDAVTGATRRDHATPLSISWDLIGRDGAVIPDGTYTLHMESSDRAAENNRATFSFTKGPEPEHQEDLASGGFSAVAIDVTP